MMDIDTKMVLTVLRKIPSIAILLRVIFFFFLSRMGAGPYQMLSLNLLIGSSDLKYFKTHYTQNDKIQR